VIEDVVRLTKKMGVAASLTAVQGEGERPKPLDIMVVDDQPANLKLLEGILTGQGYTVRSFPLGRLALQAAARVPPDLILLDINMPEMNGFEVCRRLKINDKLDRIPVLFLSALTGLGEKVQAFRSGGVDYVTKPFQVEEVRARVETHLALHRARQVERELLENTLNGAVRALCDLAQLSAPVLTERSTLLRGTVMHAVTRLKLRDAWQYELASTLCLIGCITLPLDTFERAYLGERVSDQELRMYRSHPESGARLLSHIPRLETVAEMIRLQQLDQIAWAGASAAERGSCLLRIAQELDRRMWRGTPFEAARQKLRSAPSAWPVEVVDALADYSPGGVQIEARLVPGSRLTPGMVLAEDYVTEDGSLTVMSRGTTLTVTLLERARNFGKTRRLRDPILVRTPGRPTQADADPGKQVSANATA